jgi:hypothetical protein
MPVLRAVEIGLEQMRRLLRFPHQESKVHCGESLVSQIEFAC